MATKRVATALAGYGNVPGYGKVNAPAKPKPQAMGWGGLAHFGMPSTASNYTPQTPKPPGGGVPGVGQGTGSGPTALPVDPTYDAQIGAYGRTRDDSIAGLEGQRTAGLLGYGYTATYDANGNVSGLAYDPNNPYSQAALARVAYQQSKEGSSNSLAARGQFGGALTNAQNANDTNFNVGENSRQTLLTNFLNGINTGEIAARNDYNTNFANAGADRLGRAPTNPNYTSTDAGAKPAVSPLDQWKAAAAGGTSVKTTYKNAQGHDVRVLANGSKEVLVNGVWKKV